MEKTITTHELIDALATVSSNLARRINQPELILVFAVFSAELLDELDLKEDLKKEKE